MKTALNGVQSGTVFNITISHVIKLEFIQRNLGSLLKQFKKLSIGLESTTDFWYHVNMKFYSTSHDFSGRKRKPKKPKGEVYEKYTPPPFRPIETTGSTKRLSYAKQRLAEYKQYPSRSDFAGCSNGSGNKVESKKYTGDFVIGIATMHKSNAVPVTNPKYATEISEMAK